MNWYNDNDPFVIQWLRNLIQAGHLPGNVTDPRPIQEIQPDEIRAFDQCHFFAGIGGWPLALQLAGWSGPV
ncbi:MAG TPA: DNA cytosine methyltransferase, partial [Dehalococcoidia bacterium]|nr:DNA cytosine methyltransferase [Dehalococcoidia bacterium]